MPRGLKSSRAGRSLHTIFSGSVVVLVLLSIDVAAASASTASVVGESTGAVTASSAVLSAEINPNGVDASYYFEWGTSAEYGNRVPMAAEGIGAGEATVSVSQPIAGLAADTTYHWRVVAHDESGDTNGVDQTFVYDTNGGGLPDGRRYEMVTPVHKNGAAISGLAVRHPPAELSGDGRRMIAPSDQCFAEPESCDAYRLTEGDPYAFERTSSGWVPRPLAPSAASYEATSYWTVDADAGTALFSAPRSSDGPDEFLGRLSGALLQLGPFGEQRPGPAKVQARASDIVEGGVVSTSNLDHIVYEGEEPFWSFDNGEHASVYEYGGVGSEVPLMVGVAGEADSHQLVSTCNTEFGGVDSTSKAEALSEDGRTVYFTAIGVDSGQCGEDAVAPVVSGLYERVEGESGQAHTVLVSAPTASTCTTLLCEENTSRASVGVEEERWRDASFEGASADGSRVFFTSTQQLTDGASEDGNRAASALFRNGCTTISEEGGCNLYESVCSDPCGVPGEEPDAAGRELLDLSEGAQGSGGPRVQGVMAISSDGSHVYFVAKGALTGAEENANHEVAESERENLYLYSAGHVTFIAQLAGSDAQEEEWAYKTHLIANVTPEGKFLVFTDDKALTGDDTREDGTPEAEAAAQVYEYDAETGVLKRISVGEDGFDDNGNDGVGNAYIAAARRGGASDFSVPVRLDPSMSVDGELVFFESPIGLAPGALNDVSIGQGKLAENVYEYYRGQVYLISDGKDTTEAGYVSEGAAKAPTELLGVSASGANVVFSTFDPLVAEDQDTQRDYYDAHVCSAAEPCVERSGEPVVCGEGSCQAPGMVPSSPGVPSSETLVGPGNLAAPGVVPVETSAEKLAKALKVCRVKKVKKKRVACEAAARKRYAPKPKPKAKKKKAKKSSVARHASSSRKGGE